ncbi:MAG: hypothetical protein J7J93_02690 [Candidatus Aenigmarchaeota archaeon]|nr:hypothetical protein [Candidatus Aenigmarchaeota archaeon]
MKQEKSDYMNQLVYVSILMPIIVIVSIVIYNSLSTNIDQTGWSSSANDTLTKINTGIWNGYKILFASPSVGLIILLLIKIMK